MNEICQHNKKYYEQRHLTGAIIKAAEINNHKLHGYGRRRSPSGPLLCELKKYSQNPADFIGQHATNYVIVIVLYVVCFHH